MYVCVVSVAARCRCTFSFLMRSLSHFPHLESWSCSSLRRSVQQVAVAPIASRQSASATGSQRARLSVLLASVFPPPRWVSCVSVRVPRTSIVLLRIPTLVLASLLLRGVVVAARNASRVLQPRSICLRRLNAPLGFQGHLFGSKCHLCCSFFG